MANKVTFDLGNEQSKGTVSEALEKLGKIALQLREQDVGLQRMIQQTAISNPIGDMTKVLRDSQVADLKIDPIIPKGYFEKTQEYQQKSLEILQSINENTANLYTMVELISQSNEKQDELISLLSEILALAKAKNKEEAESLFKKIMGKINDTAENVDTMIKIVGWATTIYNMVISMFPA